MNHCVPKSLRSNYFLTQIESHLIDLKAHFHYYHSINRNLKKRAEFQVSSYFNRNSIVFDNYIQQKNICKIPSKYEKIDKKIIMENLNKIINETLYSIYLFNKIKNKMELFLRILENVVSKMIDMDNVQDDILSLVNVF